MGDEGVAQELLDGYAIEVLSAMEGMVADLGALIGIDIAGAAAECFQILKDMQSAEHLVDGIGREEVVVDLVQTPFGIALVTLRPLLGIANRADRTQVHGRGEVRLAVLLDQIGEGQVAGVGVCGVAPHDEREGSDAGWPEDVRV